MKTTLRRNRWRAAVPAAAALAALLAASCSRHESAPAAATAAAPPAAPSTTAPPVSAATTPAALPASGVDAAGSPVPGQPVTSELRREPQSVKVGEAAPAPPAPPAESAAEHDLAARERRLAARVAALEAREKQLRHRETAPPVPGAGAETAAGEPAAAAESTEAAAAPDAAPPMPAEGGGAAAAPAPEEVAAGGGAGAAEPPPWRGVEEPVATAPAAPVTVPAGTPLQVAFTKGLASNTSSAGQTFRARLLGDVRLDGATAIPAGSEVVGVVTDAVAARRLGGKARLTLKFTDLVLPSGSAVPIHASFLEEGKSKTGRDAATIGGSTAGGALLGNLLGRSGRGTILGALVGAAVGTAIASNTAGEEVVIPEGSVVKLKLDEPLEIKPRR